MLITFVVTVEEIAGARGRVGRAGVLPTVRPLDVWCTP